MFWYWVYRLYSKHIDCILAVVLCMMESVAVSYNMCHKQKKLTLLNYIYFSLDLGYSKFNMLRNFRGSGFDKVSVRCLILFIYTHQNDDLWLINWSVLITGTCIASNWLQKCYNIQLIIYTLQSYIYIYYMSEFKAI